MKRYICKGMQPDSKKTEHWNKGCRVKIDFVHDVLIKQQLFPFTYKG